MKEILSGIIVMFEFIFKIFQRILFEIMKFIFLVTMIILLVINFFC